MPHLNEAGLKRQYVRLKYSETLRSALPGDLPMGEGSPAVTINEEREIAITKKEIKTDAFHM
jgi:hypothetical protein